MQNPGNIRGLFAAAIFVILIAVVLVVYVLFTPEEDTQVVQEEQPSVRLSPEDSTVERVVVNEPLSVVSAQSNTQSVTQDQSRVYEVWQEPVRTNERLPSSNVDITTSENDVISPFSIDDLSHLDLGQHNNTKPTTNYTPPPFELAPPPDPNRFPPSPSIYYSSPGSEDFDSLGQVNFTECGSVDLPDVFTDEYFEDDFSQESEAECMGEAIGNNCDDARFSARFSGQTFARIFVTEFPNGTCGVGLGTVGNELTLCSLRTVANNSSSKSQSESDWIDDFEDDPANEFAELVSGIDEVLEAETLGEFDCEEFTYNI